MAERSFAELLEPYATGAVRDGLVRYGELLESWSRIHSLVRVHDRTELVERHLLEGLAGVGLLPAGGRLLDVGSGAGIPGVPLLLGAGGGWSGVLLEPRTKRWAFLRTVVRELGLAAEVQRCRYQDHGCDAGAYSAVTCRAVGGVEGLLKWVRPRLAVGGRVLLWTTETEVRTLAKVSGWRVVSSPLPARSQACIARLDPCFT